MAQQTPAMNNADAYMQQQVKYWKGRSATTPSEVQQKYAAYQYANDHGIKGASYLSSDELSMVGGTSAPNWDNAATGIGVIGTGLAAITGNAPAAVVGGAATGISIGRELGAGNSSFGQGMNNPASGYIVGDRSDPTVPAGYGGGTGSMPNYAPQTGYTPQYGQPPLDPNDPSNGAWGALIPAGGVPGTGSYAQPDMSGLAQGGFGGFAPGAFPASAPSGGVAPYRTPSSAPGQPPNVPSSGDPYLDAILAQQGKTATDNRVAVTSLYGDPVMRQGVLNQQANQALGTNLATQQGNINGFVQNNNQILQNYGNGLGAITAYDAANTQNYQTQLANTPVLQAPAYWGDVTAQQAGYQTAALSQANYQTAQLSQAELYQAAMERAQSNGTDVNAEYAALKQLQQNAAGALDVTNGAASPEAYQAQLSALSQMGNLTTPQRTAQEEFLYEQQRGQEEQQQRSSRAAVMSNLRARGMSGSGMELTDQLGSDQITSQNRLLGDLGIQSIANQRAQNMLNSYGQLGTAMNAQGNQVQLANQGVRAGSAEAQGSLASNIRGQSDAMAQFNANAFNQNAIANAEMGNANSIANAGFANQNSQFNANAYNSNSQFNANASNQNSMFNANAYNSNQQFNTGQANAIAQSNQNQQGVSAMFNANYASQQQAALTGRQTSSYNAGTGLVDRTTGNLNSLTGTSLGVGASNLNAQNQGTQATTDYWNGVSARGQQGVINGAGLASALTGPAVSPNYNDILSSMSGARVAGALNPKLNF